MLVVLLVHQTDGCHFRICNSKNISTACAITEARFIKKNMEKCKIMFLIKLIQDESK